MKHILLFDLSRTTTLRAMVGTFAVGATVLASAVTSFKVTIKNTSGAAVNDIHLVFRGTGGTIANRVVVNPGGGVIQAGLGNEFNAKFNDLANNAKFIGTFDCDSSLIIYDSGKWTKDGADAGAIAEADVTLEAVPEPASLIALSVGAVSLLRRRRRVA